MALLAKLPSIIDGALGWMSIEAMLESAKSSARSIISLMGLVFDDAHYQQETLPEVSSVVEGLLAQYTPTRGAITMTKEP